MPWQTSLILKMVGATGFEATQTGGHTSDALNSDDGQKEDTATSCKNRAEQNVDTQKHSKDSFAPSASCAGVAQAVEDIDSFLPVVVQSWRDLPLQTKRAILVLAGIL